MRKKARPDTGKLVKRRLKKNLLGYKEIRKIERKKIKIKTA
jgi:hypothetical protein